MYAVSVVACLLRVASRVFFFVYLVVLLCILCFLYVVCRLFVVCCLLFVVGCLVLVVRWFVRVACSLPVVCWCVDAFVVSCLLFFCLWFGASGPLFDVGGSLFVLCCVLFVV